MCQLHIFRLRLGKVGLQDAGEGLAARNPKSAGSDRVGFHFLAAPTCPQRFAHESEQWRPPPSSQALEFVVRVHYSQSMKTAVIPQVRVEPELRAALDAALLPGETLTDFVEASVRRAVEFRRVQTDFAARCDASLAEYECTGISVPLDVVLSKLEAKVAARVKQLRK